MKRRRWFFTIFIFGFIAILFGILICFGIIPWNTPSTEKYPVRGVDLSHYQGDVDWQVLSQEGIQFAFIKATEGSSSIDPNFHQNFQRATKTSLRIGAYHFFSFESGGITQAEHFIQQVPKFAKMLPPVIDLEFYGEFQSNPPSKEVVQRELSSCSNRLEEYYGIKPIIYTTYSCYKQYISGSFLQHDIWIRDIMTRPHLNDERQWTFWQYTSRARLSGYQGDTPYIDCNVFYGTQKQFDQYPYIKQDTT